MNFENNYECAISGLCEELKSVLLKIDDDFKKSCSEVRVRINKPVIIVCGEEKYSVDGNGCTVKIRDGFICTKEMLRDSFSRICDYSIHTHSADLVKGFITVKGGHRIGIAGTAVIDSENNITAVRDISSICIRVAREIKGCSREICRSLFYGSAGNIILAGPPSSGKTTVLRDIVRVLSDRGSSVALIDERQEIAALNKGICTNDVGINTDVYCGYPKETAINMAVRTMSPDIIAIDEICDEKEVDAIVRAVNCGVRLIVTLHATDLKDIASKYQSLALLRTGVFERVVILNKDSEGFTNSVYNIEELNDEIYRSRTFMDKLSFNGSESFRAV